MLMATAAPANVSYNIVATYPHNTDSYTQGLIWQNNSLYEGTGLERHSKLMMVDLKTGKEQGTVVKNADDIFGRVNHFHTVEMRKFKYQPTLVGT